MKKTKITLILGWLLLLSSNLSAQKSEGRFNLKEGDWFEVQVEQNYNSTFKSKDQLKKYLLNGSTSLLNYQMKKQLANGNQEYTIRLDHFKNKKKYDNVYFGYDSYYPLFEENKTNPEIKNQFSLEVTPAGKIIRLTPFKNNKASQISLTEISSSHRTNNTTNYLEEMIDSSMIIIFSNYLMLPVSDTNKILYTTESRVPLIIDKPELQMRITDASFPLITNAIILGHIKEQINQEVKISMIGENSDYFFPEKHFKTQSNGSFNCPIFLKRPLHLRIQIGDQSLTTFMEPGKTLNISAIGNQALEIQHNQYADTKPNEYYTPGWKKSDYFKDNAAYNTMLSNELDQYRSGFSSETDIQSVITNDKKTKQAVYQLIESYRGKASDECIRYFQSDFKYFLSVAKLYFDDAHWTYYWNDFQYHKFRRTTDKVPDIDFPTDFFLEVDTMSILMNPFEWNSSYQNFIQMAQVYKQNRLGWAAGKRYVGTFLENYYFSHASLCGYPLYSQIANSIDLEFRNGSDINSILPYYFNFLNNCADPALTEPLKKVYEAADKLKSGNQFPLNSFLMKDSSIFNLEKFKGKPVCLIILHCPKPNLDRYLEEISKFKQDEVEFIFARLPLKNRLEGNIYGEILKKPNVTFIELADQNIASKLLLDRNKIFTLDNLLYPNRIFMLDKWFRIVENNAEDPMIHKYNEGISKFEKSLRKTIDTKRYTKAEKTAMIKTAGWSFGSILFTFLIGLWIYRIRIRRLKAQEAAKRRIQELEIKAIRSQMNPHFIFNALNSIQSLINGNQFKEANIYLSKFAVLLRGVLNNSEKSRISLSDELQAVELYCQLEQLRFEFKFEISIDPELNADLIEIPGMIIQPLAENAVVHGLSGKGELGKLNIQVKRQNGNLCICVSDNGVGLTAEKVDCLSQKGFGLKLVEERINILNLDGKEAKLTVENRSNTTGTVATLIIPID
jgi:two-component sensor histidine kinase